MGTGPVGPMSRNEAPDGREEKVKVELPCRAKKAFIGFSKTKVSLTFVAGASPVLQTRAPTGNVSGPVETSLLSSPMTFHVIGLI